MRKEVIFAVIAGSIMGLVIAFGVWRANQTLSSKKEEVKSEATPQISLPSSTPKPEVGLAILVPENEFLSTASPIKVKGITKTGSFVAISGEDKDYVIETSASGEFEVDVELIPGANEIKVFSFDKIGLKNEKSIVVVYSSEFAKEISSTDSERAYPDTTSSAVRDKVREKIEEKLRFPRAFLGSVTDISTSTIQIKSLGGEIKQVSFDKETTTFVKVDSKAPKEVKSKDLAIGDFIIAMGFRNGNSVLEARRILITEPFKFSERIAVFGKIIGTSKNSIATTEWSIEPQKALAVTEVKDGKAKTIRFTDIKEEDIIVAVGIPEGKILKSRRIHVLSTEPTPTPTSKVTSSPTPKSSPTTKPTVTP
ncbi:hypothetical protein HY008_01060 [Candidatus Woesebacteria bacterium]|nr:hypothetical protein [Candidatus Woesebacteria bacterium]